MRHTKKTLIRRGSALLIALGIATLSLAGCGRGTDPGTTSGTSGAQAVIDDKPATGTVELWAAGGDGEKLPEMFEKFKAENPDVTINMTQIPEADFLAKMSAALSAGQVPDLVYLFTEFTPTLLATGQFSPVPDGLVDGSKFFDFAWNTTKVDGTAYGVPWYTYGRMLYYRADHAKAAGVTPPTSWSELKPFLKGMQAQGIKKPLKLATTPFDAYTAMEFDWFAHQNGGGLISDDLSTWTIDSPQNIEALEFYSSLVTEGYADVDQGSQLDLTARFTTDNVAAAVIGPWFRGWLLDAQGEQWVNENLGVTALTTGNSGDKAAMVGGGNWAVPKEAKNPDAAWKFARWMAQPEQQVEWKKVFGNLPAVTAAWDDPAIAGDENLTPIREALEVGITIPLVANWNEVGLVIGTQIERVERGQATAEQALKEAQTQAVKIGVGS